MPYSALDGRVAPRKDNEVLVVNDKAYVGDKAKAQQFAKVYKKESLLREKNQKVSIRDKILKRENRKFLNNEPTEKQEYEEEIVWQELERVIGDSSTNKAAGDDNIPYDIIRKLGPKAKEFILCLYNKVWMGEQIPQRWRTAVIKPLLKEGKGKGSKITRLVQTNRTHLMSGKVTRENCGRQNVLIP